MAKVSYHPEPGVSDETTQFGYDFADGKPVKVDDPKALAKFRGNKFFKVSEKEDKEEKPVDGLAAVHNGGGRFVIKRNGETIKEGLNKSDADAFNALSDEDKAAYVE